MPLGGALSGIAALGSLLFSLLGSDKKNTTRKADDPRYKSPSLQVLDPGLLTGVLQNVQRKQNFGFPTAGKIDPGQSSRVDQTLGVLKDQWPAIVGNWEGGEDGSQYISECTSSDQCKWWEKCEGGRCVKKWNVDFDFDSVSEGAYDGDTTVSESDPRYKSPSLQVLDPLTLGQTFANYGRYENFGYPNTATTPKLGGLEQGGYIRQILDSLSKQWPEIIGNWADMKCGGDQGCPEGYFCDRQTQTCVPDPGLIDCNSDEDCPNGWPCKDGKCQPQASVGDCKEDSDCTPPAKCQNGWCVEPYEGKECTHDDAGDRDCKRTYGNCYECGSSLTCHKIPGCEE